MSSYLIAATFRYEQSQKLLGEAVGTENRRHEARHVAVKLFGRAGFPPTPENKFDNFFLFAAAYPYQLPDNPTQEEIDAVAPTHLFGWVGIIQDDSKLQALKAFVVNETNSFRSDQVVPPITNWQESAFYRIFDIEARSFDPICGWENDTLVRDATYWQEKGFEIYRAQTPKQWDGMG